MNNYIVILYSYFIKRFLSILFYYYNLYSLYTCINKIRLNVLFNYIVDYYIRFEKKRNWYSIHINLCKIIKALKF